MSSLLTAGMATRGTVPSDSSSTGQKEHELQGLIRKFTQLHHPKVPCTELFSHTSTSDNHDFTSTMSGWNTGKGFQQNPAGVPLSAVASQREHAGLQTCSTVILTLWSYSGELTNYHLEGIRKEKMIGFLVITFLKNKQLSISIKLKTSFYGEGCSEKKTPQILYQKKTFFRHTQRYCRKKNLLIYTNIAGGQTQEQKT